MTATTPRRPLDSLTPRAPRNRPGVLVTLAPEEKAALDALAAEDTVSAGVPVSRSRVAGRLALEEMARRHPRSGGLVWCPMGGDVTRDKLVSCTPVKAE